MVADLDQNLKLLLESYFKKRCAGSPEMVKIIKTIWERHPKALRTKEVFETFEAFRKIEPQIV